MAATLKMICLDCGDIVSSCSSDKWKVMAGKLDWSKVAESTEFVVVVEHDNGDAHELANVCVGRGDHVARVGDEWVIPVEAIIPTVRLFVSCCVRRNKLFDPPMLDIQPE